MKTVFLHGSVYTGELPLCQAFAVENGRFCKTGQDGELLAAAEEGDELIDLHGAFVCAGFNDSHMHLLSFGQSLHTAQLARHTDSLRGMLEYLAGYLRDDPPRPGQWLTGRGWNQD